VLVITVLMLSVARAGDMYGKKKLFAAGLALFTLSSLLCGLSPSVGWLIGFRALQGLGAVMTQALGAAIVVEIFPPSERGRAMGIIGGVVSLGLAFGPPVGGLLIGTLGWQSIFLVNVPLGILAMLVFWRFVPSTPPLETGQRFDLIGALILLVALAGYALGMTMGQNWGFGDSRILTMLAVALIGLVIFLITESRINQPMLDLTLFRNPLFSINLLMGLLVFIALGGTFIMPFFLEMVKGYSTQHVGLMMMVVPVVMGAVSPLAGSLSDRFGPRGISIVGLCAVVAGCLAISTLHAGVTWLGFVLRMVPFGLGLGIFQAPNQSAIMGEAPRARLGLASGLLNFSRSMGHTSGVPLMGVIFTVHVLAVAHLPARTDFTAAPPTALVAGVTGAYRVAALVIAVSTVLAVAALLIDRRRQAAAPAGSGHN